MARNDRRTVKRRGRGLRHIYPTALDRRRVRRFEVLHVLHAVVEREARLLDFTATQPYELVFHQPDAVVLRWYLDRLQALVALAAHEHCVATLLVDNRPLAAVELDAALREVRGPVEDVGYDRATFRF